MKSSISTIALGLMGSGLAITPTSAATLAASFGVTATVHATCMVSASALTIVAQAGSDGTIAVSVACSHSVPYSVALSVGPAHRIALATPALSRSGAALWTAAFVSPFLQGVDPGPTVHLDSVAGAGKGSSQTLAANARFPATPDTAAGPHADSIAVTVTY